MTIYIEADFDRHMVNRIIQAYESKKRKDTLIIYLSSSGGSVASYEVLDIFMNERREDIVLIGVGYLFSAALQLFTTFMGRKSLVQGVTGLLHLPRTEVTTNLNGTIADGQENLKLFFQDKKFINNWIAPYKELLTPEEFKIVKSGKDLWLNSDRMLKLMKDQDKLYTKEQ